MESGIDPRLALGAAEQQDIAARGRMAENLAQGGADDEARRAKMRQACEGFESIFIQKMWEQMRATLPREGLMKSKEEEFWMSLYDQELAKSVAGAGGIGLADMMMAQMSRNDTHMGEASRVSPPRRTALNVQPAPLLPSGAEARAGQAGDPAVTESSSVVPVPSGEDNPAGVFARKASARFPAEKSAVSSIYDGEAPMEASAGVSAEASAEVVAGVSEVSAGTLAEAALRSSANAFAERSPRSLGQPGESLPGETAQAPVTPLPGTAAVSSGMTADDPVRQTLDEIRNTVASAQGSASVSGRPENPRARNAAAPAAVDPLAAEAQAAPTVIRVRYQTNLPPNQRGSSAEKMLQAMREAQRPVPARGISSGSPYEAEAARPAAPAAQPVPVPAPDSGPLPERAEADRAPADPLAGIQPRFIPSRFSNPLYASRSEAANFAVSMSGAVRPSLASANTTMTALAGAYPVSSGLPDMSAPVQSGGPALSAPETVREAVALGNPAPARGSLEAPVSGDISSGFGWRVDPFTGRRSWHTGVDIKAGPGEAVRAARGGVVSFAGEHPELGNLVVVDHGDGLRTFYGHNRSLDVRVGQTVSAGMELAQAGSSGRASGTHVHFEVRRGDLALNPEPLIRQGNMLLADAR